MVRLVVLLALVVAACSSGADPATPGTDAPAATASTAATSAPTTGPPVSLPTAAAEDTGGDQAPPVGANGIALDAAGDVWLADLDGDQVLQVDLPTGEILRRFPTPEGAGPDDVAIDEAGRVFWTGFTSGQVGRIDPASGEHVVVADVPPGANPIAFSPDGRLFVGLIATADQLYEVDPEGRTPPRLMSEDLGNVNGFVVAADGMIHGPRATGELVRIDHESGAVLAVLASDLGFGASVREEAPGVLWWLAVTPSPRLIRLEVAPGSDEAVRGAEVTVDSPLVDNFAIALDGTFVVSAFDRPVLLLVDPTTGTTAEIPVGDAASS